HREGLRLHYAVTPASLAAVHPRQPRKHQADGRLRRSFLPDVGLLSRRLRSGLPLHESNGLPDPDRPPPERRAPDARLSDRRRERRQRAEFDGGRVTRTIPGFQAILSTPPLLRW